MTDRTNVTALQMEDFYHLAAGQPMNFARKVQALNLAPYLLSVFRKSFKELKCTTKTNRDYSDLVWKAGLESIPLMKNIRFLTAITYVSLLRNLILSKLRLLGSDYFTSSNSDMYLVAAEKESQHWGNSCYFL